MQLSLYHGTSSKYVEAIKQRGIVPGGGVGATSWASQNGLPLLHAKDAATEPWTYLTSQTAIAGAFAKIVAEMTGGVPVVLSIELPEAERKLLEHDSRLSFDLVHAGLKTRAIVKPEWIVDVLDASRMEIDPSMDFASNPDFMERRNAEFTARFLPESARSGA